MALIQRSEAIQPLFMAKVYQISSLDNNLQLLIARDPILNTLCYKAANLLIIVPEPNSQAFNKRLASLGYMPDQTQHATVDKIKFKPMTSTLEGRCQAFDELFLGKKPSPKS